MRANCNSKITIGEDRKSATAKNLSGKDDRHRARNIADSSTKTITQYAKDAFFIAIRFSHVQRGRAAVQQQQQQHQQQHAASSRRRATPFLSSRALSVFPPTSQKNIATEKMAGAPAEEIADGGSAIGSRARSISEKLQPYRKSVYEPPLRRSRLFVFVNIASSRSLSRSRARARARGNRDEQL